MKKLFTLSIAFFYVVAINAQVSESGNGFAKTFTYEDSTVYDDVAYEGIGAEWPDGSFIEDGKLRTDLDTAKDDEGYGAIGMWDLEMDLTGNTDILFKYQFPDSAGFGIWIEDSDGGGNEIFPEDLELGTSELQDYTFDASAISDVDLSKVVEIWIMFETDSAGTFYFDDLVIGDGSLTTGISSKVVQSSWLAYPNPASEEFRINADIKSLSIFNSIGQMVYSRENYQKGSSVDIRDLGKGLYIIKADENTHKLMVE